MKKWTILWLSGLMGLAVGPHALSAESESTTAAAPYLLAGAPSFDQSISQFREKFNADNPKLPLNEFRSIATSRDRANLTRAASKINENLYASTALERGTLKIKSMQITWLPIQGPEQKAARTKALEYMSAMIRAFVPTFSQAQSQQKLQKLLDAGKGKRYFADTEGAVRYVVADHGEKGLTFAIEPIKLALSETLEGNNK
ncbi:YiiQ family protein [Klebsiella pneumoniae]|uniref:YiiQ family protein n=1 Tax=Klebsiella pneumoniae TaxID=573 RepID=UPI00071E1F17|nr:YiiQ family protein [Klebsiella pneumoniae]HBQ5874997.1 YiiQ family protein [Klebsiella pneumoniae subsp. pneumoniae]EIX9099078.1 YiiQ family protein [Klebsiella pneumoniae]EIX9289595.1 YiiQ family protein [Klebsiella pneumoniae]EIY1429957.1 YiiQ family protein [Klebsiella pneumoniae]EJM9049199.1 YiiQ family protein [Klebsiella pneumoniae]